MIYFQIVNQMDTKFKQLPPKIVFPGTPITLDTTPYQPDWTTANNLITQLITTKVLVPSFKRFVVFNPTVSE